MRADLKDVVESADVPLVPGMLTDMGRVISVDAQTVMIWDGSGHEVDAADPVPDLEDPATYFLCLGFLCARVGLEPSSGVLWYRSSDGDDAWVLEGTDEVRTRDADTDDPLLALARALAETA